MARTISFLRIFYSSYSAFPDYDNLESIKDLLDDRVICLRIEILTTISKFHKILESPRELSKVTFGPGREFEGHLALKKLAAEYLLKRGKNSKYEKYLFGSFPDVSSDDNTTIIECGNTPPNKIIDYLSDGSESVGILPFPFDGDTSLNLYWFSKGEGFTDYIDSKKKYLKEIHRKYHSGNHRN